MQSRFPSIHGNPLDSLTTKRGGVLDIWFSQVLRSEHLHHGAYKLHHGIQACGLSCLNFSINGIYGLAISKHPEQPYISVEERWKVFRNNLFSAWSSNQPPPCHAPRTRTNLCSSGITLETTFMVCWVQFEIVLRDVVCQRSYPGEQFRCSLSNTLSS